MAEAARLRTIDRLDTGPRFTAADVLWGTALTWTTAFKLVPHLPVIQAYLERWNARPSAARAKAKDAELAGALAAELRELLEQLALFLLEVFRRLDLNREEQIPATSTAEVRDPVAAQTDHGARLGAGIELHALDAVERFHVQLRPE